MTLRDWVGRGWVLLAAAVSFAGAAAAMEPAVGAVSPAPEAVSPAPGAVSPRAAANYVWRNVKVGGGGFAPNIVFSRVESGLAYLRTDMGGIYRWDAHAQVWIPLQDAMPESSYFGIESIAADPLDANLVYVAAGMYRRDSAAILRSHDRGNTWEIFPVAFRMGGNEDGRGVGERLAIDPNDTSTLYFGSRHDGLQRSTDSGQTWSPVTSFPVHGRGLPPSGERRTHAGISFEVFDPASAAEAVGLGSSVEAARAGAAASGAEAARATREKGPGSARLSRTVFVAVADPGEQHLFRSDDGGASWTAVTGQPRADLLPVKAELDERGVLYIAYSNGVGPNGVTDGGVYKYDTHSGQWTDITPERGPDRAKGGYMGLSLDRGHPETLVVASLNRWRPGDILWRTTDGGRTWRNVREFSRRDVAATPFLLWGQKEADFGWWMAGLAIDPFDSNFVAYTTGATVYATHDLQNADRGAPLLWRPWVEGVEQTAVLTLASPPAGPPLLSGFGDISGFAHEDLAVSPTEQFTNPVFSNTNTIDYAGRAPDVVVRSGTPAPRAKGGEPTLAFSTDYGRSWSPLEVPPVGGTGAQVDVPKQRYDLTGDAAITVSADGSRFVFMSPVPLITPDRGRTWMPVRGLPTGLRPIADRVDAKAFYALDFAGSTLYASADGGETFSALPTAGLPKGLQADRPAWRELPWPLMATPGEVGDLWLVSRQGLFHSRDGGRSFVRVSGHIAGTAVGRGDADQQPGREDRARVGVAGELGVMALSFGRAPPGRIYPALFALGVDLGSPDMTRGIWRSDDLGVTWIRVNDATHEYGRRFRCIAGDPRVFGRVYVGTDGRGILYGEPRK